MVFEKIKEMFNGNDEKYEILYYKYSKLKLENQKLKENHYKELSEHKGKVHSNVANQLIKVYESIETVKSDSFKVKATDKEMQRLLIDINKAEKDMKELMKEYSLEEITPSERFYDPELHEIASYEDSKGMQKGIIIKTVKKGFKYRGNLIRRPKVVVTK